MKHNSYFCLVDREAELKLSNVKRKSVPGLGPGHIGENHGKGGGEVAPTAEILRKLHRVEWDSPRHSDGRYRDMFVLQECSHGWHFDKKRMYEATFHYREVIGPPLKRPKCGWMRFDRRDRSARHTNPWARKHIKRWGRTYPRKRKSSGNVKQESSKVKGKEKMGVDISRF